LALKHQKNLNKIVDRHDFDVSASYALHMALEKSSNKEVIQLATEISKDYVQAKSKKFKQMSASGKKRATLPVDMPDSGSRQSIIRTKKDKEDPSGSQMKGQNITVYSSGNKGSVFPELKKNDDEGLIDMLKQKKHEKKSLYMDKNNELLNTILNNKEVLDKELFKVFDNPKIVSRFINIMIAPKQIAKDDKINKILNKRSEVITPSGSPSKTFSEKIYEQTKRSSSILMFLMNKVNINNITTACDDFLENFMGSIKHLAENNAVENEAAFILVLEYLIMLEPKFTLAKLLTPSFFSFLVSKLEYPTVQNFLLNLLSLDDRFFSFKNELKSIIYSKLGNFDFLLKLLQSTIENTPVEYESKPLYSKGKGELLTININNKDIYDSDLSDPADSEASHFMCTEEPRYGRFINFY
jgi:hypothetical protein